MDSAHPSFRLAWLLRAFGFVALLLAAFTLPDMPSTGLDSSWQMALGRFFQEGRQFGTDVVFTYGPLGWINGNMYWGGQWGSLIAWHVLQAAILAALVLWQAERFPWSWRAPFLAFFFLLGLKYQDIQQQAALLLAGLELIRRADVTWRWSNALLLVPLVLFPLVKFTNLTLALPFVLLGAARAWHARGPRAAAELPGAFAVAFLAGWILCGQNPLHLPAYLRNSWEISSGYQDAMGAPCPTIQLYHGLGVAALLVISLAASVFAATDRRRASALALGTAAYLFLNWKHGFVRADGHQLLFYMAALVAIVAAPFASEQLARGRWLRLLVLVAAAGLALRGAELVIPGTLPDAASSLVARMRRNLTAALHPAVTRADFDRTLASVRQELDLPLTRAVTKSGTVDILGYEQSLALFNNLPYAPRPVFQSYSAYTPHLAQLNERHYLSPAAPEFVLLKLYPINNQLATMEDPLVLRLFAHGYNYLYTEHGFTVWQRKPGAIDPAALAPQPVRTVTAGFGETVRLDDLRDRHVWVRIVYRLNLLGKLRRLFFKPPAVQLRLTDADGGTSDFFLARPVGETGFLLNPVVENLADYMRVLAGDPRRRAVAVSVVTRPNDRDCFASDITFEFSTLTAATNSGLAGLPLGAPERPLTFVRGRVPFGADLSLTQGHLEYFAHAPASLVYRPAPGSTHLRGGFGLREGAYAPSNRSPSDGAAFIIRWRGADGQERELFRRLLQPLGTPADRGLHEFRVSVPPGEGELEFVTDPGPTGNSACDWTYWSDLQLEKSP